jgi:hypothetical protein
MNQGGSWERIAEKFGMEEWRSGVLPGGGEWMHDARALISRMVRISAWAGWQAFSNYEPEYNSLDLHCSVGGGWIDWIFKGEEQNIPLYVGGIRGGLDFVEDISRAHWGCDGGCIDGSAADRVCDSAGEDEAVYACRNDAGVDDFDDGCAPFGLSVHAVAPIFF